VSVEIDNVNVEIILGCMIVYNDNLWDCNSPRITDGQLSQKRTRNRIRNVCNM